MQYVLSCCSPDTQNKQKELTENPLNNLQA